ncbi:hypothetical protein VCHENC02_2753B, partial [Vibrio harveyi]
KSFFSGALDVIR